MKIKPEHYAAIVAGMRATVERLGMEHVLKYRDDLRTVPHVGDPEKRFRWDLFRAAGLITWACDTLYPYANDTHIDTALRSAVSDLGLTRNHERST